MIKWKQTNDKHTETNMYKITPRTPVRPMWGGSALTGRSRRPGCGPGAARSERPPSTPWRPTQSHPPEGWKFVLQWMLYLLSAEHCLVLSIGSFKLWCWSRVTCMPNVLLPFRKMLSSSSFLFFFFSPIENMLAQTNLTTVFESHSPPPSVSGASAGRTRWTCPRATRRCMWCGRCGLRGARKNNNFTGSHMFTAVR